MRLNNILKNKIQEVTIQIILIFSSSPKDITYEKSHSNLNFNCLCLFIIISFASQLSSSILHFL